MKKKRNIAVAASFTAEPLEEVLSFWMQEIGKPVRIKFSPYNQIFQQLLDPSSIIYRNSDGINIILIRFEDWQRFKSPSDLQPYPGSDTEDMIERNANELISALKSFKLQSQAPLLVCICSDFPGSKGNPDDHDVFSRIRRMLSTELVNTGGIMILNMHELFDLYPVENHYDSQADKLAHIPFTQPFFTALGTLIARRIYASLNKPYKVIVLDGDQTLWKGVCAEDGISDIEIDPPRMALQQFMVKQHDAGKLICLCSKNSEEDIIQVFEKRQEMPLKREHIISWRINWQSKSDNIRSLAEELQLGLDSFIIFDDNPLECAEIQIHCPEALVFQLPENSENIERFLKHVWALDQANVTAEDKRRTVLYKQNIQRNHFRNESLTLESFIHGLALDVKIMPLSPDQLPRVSQLTLRTNQFNAMALHRSEDEIRNFCEKKGCSCLVTEVGDRFGDYGLVGLMMFHKNADRLDVDSFLLSCRVLGRGVEHRMLSALGKTAEAQGCTTVTINYVATHRNQPVLNFLESIAADLKEVSIQQGPVKQETDNGCLFSFPVDSVKDLDFTPSAGKSVAKVIPSPMPEQSTENSPERPMSPSGPVAELLNRIATDMTDPVQILEKIRARFTPSNIKVLTGKIENVLTQHPYIRRAEVRHMEDAADHEQFVASVAAATEHSPVIEGKRRYLLPNNLAVVYHNKIESDFLYDEIFVNRSYMKHGIDLNEGDCVIDAGANIGMFSLFIQQNCKDAQILVFEPAPPIFDYLRINMELYVPNAKIFNYGLSDGGKTQTLSFFTNVPGFSSCHSDEIYKHDMRVFLERQLNEFGEEAMTEENISTLLKRSAQSESFDVPFRALSDVLLENSIDKVDLLKLDVEGSELDVLNGIRNKDWDKIKQIVSEVHSRPLLNQMSKLLEDKGYRVTVDQEPVMKETEIFMLYARQSTEEGSTNGSKQNHADPFPVPVLDTELLGGNMLREYVKEKIPGINARIDIMFVDHLKPEAGETASLQEDASAPDCTQNHEKSFMPPSTSTEEKLAVIWADVLDVDRIGINDNFFDLGGHSLLGVMLVSRTLETFDLELPLTIVFQYPTVAAMAEFIDNELIAHIEPEELNDALNELDGLSDTEVRELLDKESKGR